jgi:transposase
MRLGRPKVALILTDDERVQLNSLAHRSRTAPHLARRARIILACAEGHDNKVVAKRLRVSPVTVCKWRGQFIREPLAGLYDEPRPGAPRRITDEEIEAVIVRTLEDIPHGATHWSTRGMAKASGLGRTTVSEIWRAIPSRQTCRARCHRPDTPPRGAAASASPASASGGRCTLPFGRHPPGEAPVLLGHRWLGHTSRRVQVPDPRALRAWSAPADTRGTRR